VAPKCSRQRGSGQGTLPIGGAGALASTFSLNPMRGGPSPSKPRSQTWSDNGGGCRTGASWLGGLEGGYDVPAERAEDDESTGASGGRVEGGEEVEKRENEEEEEVVVTVEDGAVKSAGLVKASQSPSASWVSVRGRDELGNAPFEPRAESMGLGGLSRRR